MTVTPLKIELAGEDRLQIEWNDGPPIGYDMLAEKYRSAYLVFDPSNTAGPYFGPFYTTLDAWHFGAVPVHSENFDGIEVIDGETDAVD